MSKNSVCDMCAHCGAHQDRNCTFKGNCIVNTYNLHGTGTLEAFINPQVEEVVVEEPVAVVEEVAVDPNFNPFQRGNGCMLADLVKTR
ncbi:MAG: hypothetical protein II208_00075 [Alphaproteobacteria bacterium]|nr:hypothetical protein [Alphaproteobacteria bacterium]